jgi:hypothetical protein
MAAAALPASATWLTSNSSLFELSRYQRWEYLFFSPHRPLGKKRAFQPPNLGEKILCRWRPSACIFLHYTSFMPPRASLMRSHGAGWESSLEIIPWNHHLSCVQQTIRCCRRSSVFVYGRTNNRSGS